MTNTTEHRLSAARRSKNRTHGRSQAHARVRARPIYPGRSYKITRRCLERRMFFAPGMDAEKINNFIGYCLAHAANEFKIQVHACVFMSNHHHTDITDPLGQLPHFKQLFHSLLARGINVLRKRFDAVWSPEQACDTRRPREDETFTDLVYTLANPVKDGLVKWGDQWLGFTTHGWQFGESRTFERPDWFFGDDGGMPDKVTLTLMRPPIYSELTDGELFRLLMDAVRTREMQYQVEFRRSGRRFMGREKLLRQRWDRVPQGFAERFVQKPHIAASSVVLKMAELRSDRAWRREYASAREQLLAGGDAVFPYGTYWMRRFAGVQVRPPPRMA